MRLLTDLSGPSAWTDAARLVLAYAGICLSLVSAKMSVLAWRRRQWERTFETGTLSAALLTPALFLLAGYGEPLPGLVVVYVVAVTTGCAWTWRRVRFNLRWRSFARYHEPVHRAPLDR